MNAVVGFVATAALLYSDAIRARPKRQIGKIKAQVTIRESHREETQITDHPVEQGAMITDHAFELPSEVILECAWSNSPSKANPVDGTIAAAKDLVTGNTRDQVRSVYEDLLKLKAARDPVDVYTGKKLYRNMLVKSLAMSNDDANENALFVTVTMRQVLLVSTRTVSGIAPPARQAQPALTNPPTDAGTQAPKAGTGRFNSAGQQVNQP